MGRILANNKISGYVELIGSTPETDKATAVFANQHNFDKAMLMEVNIFFETINPVFILHVASDAEVETLIEDAVDLDVRTVRFTALSDKVIITLQTRGDEIEHIGDYAFSIRYNIIAVHE